MIVMLHSNETKFSNLPSADLKQSAKALLGISYPSLCVPGAALGGGLAGTGTLAVDAGAYC